MPLTFLKNTSPKFGETISKLWLFAILNVVFRDIHELTTASAIAEITSGYVNGNPVTEEALLAGAFAVELFLLAMLLSHLLQPKAARLLNLFLTPLALAGSWYIPPADPDDMFFAITTTLTFTIIFFLSWQWAPEVSKTQKVGGQNVL